MAGTLSRAYLPDTPTAEIDDDLVQVAHSSITNLPVTATKLKEIQQAADRTLQKVKLYCLFWLYLVGKPSILQTDHQPLAYMNKTKYQSDRIMRWALALQGYDYTVQDIPGKDNVAADNLSHVLS